jgi:hypothetical protein
MQQIVQVFCAFTQQEIPSIDPTLSRANIVRVDLVSHLWSKAKP